MIGVGTVVYHYDLDVGGDDDFYIHYPNLSTRGHGQAYALLPVWISGVGDVVHDVHSPDKCKGESCVIHNPSTHSMTHYPTHWRSREGLGRGYGFMERICPHGIGHPDPDDTAFLALSHSNDWIATHLSHGCDGCCKESTS